MVPARSPQSPICRQRGATDQDVCSLERERGGEFALSQSDDIEVDGVTHSAAQRATVVERRGRR